MFHLVVADNPNVEQGFHVVLVQFQNLAVGADARLYLAEQDMSARLDGKRIYIVGIDGKQRIADGNHLGRIVARIVVFDKLQIDAALEPRLLFLDFQQQIFVNVGFSQTERLRLHIFEKVVESNALLLRQFDELNLLLLVAFQPVKSQSKGNGRQISRLLHQHQFVHGKRTVPFLIGIEAFCLFLQLAETRFRLQRLTSNGKDDGNQKELAQNGK